MKWSQWLHRLVSWIDWRFYPKSNKKYVLNLLIFQLVMLVVSGVSFWMMMKTNDRNVFITLFSFPIMYYLFVQGVSGLFFSYIYPDRDFPSAQGKEARRLSWLYLLGFVTMVVMLFWVTGRI